MIHPLNIGNDVNKIFTNIFFYLHFKSKKIYTFYITKIQIQNTNSKNIM